MRVIIAVRVQITTSARVRDISVRMSVKGNNDLCSEYL